MTKTAVLLQGAIAIWNPWDVHAFHSLCRSVPKLYQPASSVTAVSATEDVTTDAGKDFLSRHANLDQLLKSQEFLSTLADDELSRAAHHYPHPHTDATSFYDTDIEMQMLKDRKAMDHLLRSREFRSSLDSESKEEDSAEEMISQHTALAHLMQSDDFRHSLNVDDSLSSKPFHAVATTTVDENSEEHEFDIRNGFSRQMLQQKSELSNLMQDDSKLKSRENDFHSSLELLVHRGALNTILSSSSFRSSLHPNNENEGDHKFSPHSNMADSHLHTLLVGEDEEQGFPATDYDFDLAMLRGKAALNRLLSASSKRHRDH